MVVSKYKQAENLQAFLSERARFRDTSPEIQTITAFDICR